LNLGYIQENWLNYSKALINMTEVNTAYNTSAVINKLWLWHIAIMWESNDFTWFVAKNIA